MHRRFIEGVIRHHVLVLVVSAIVSGVATYWAAKTEFDASIEIWFLEDDPEILSYRRFGETFGADEFLMVGVFAKNVFEAEVLQVVERLAGQVESLDGVARIESILTARTIESRDDDLVIEPVLTATRSREGLAAARRRALADPSIAGTLVAEDATACAILIYLEPGTSTSFEGKTRLVEQVEVLAKAESRLDLEVIVGGSPSIGAGVQRHSKRDFMVLGGLAVLLIMVATRLLFGRLSTMIFPISVVALACLLVLALMAVLGLKVNLVSQSITAVLLTVGVADAVHVLSDLRIELAKGRPIREAVLDTCTVLFPPCFFTFITTAIGMLSLLTSALRPIAESGVLTAAGVAFAFVATFTVLPAMLVTWPRLAPTRAPENDRMERFLRHAGSPTPKRARFIVTIALVATGTSLLLIPYIDVGANALAYFKASDPIRRNIERIDGALGGATSMEVLASAPGGGMRDREKLLRLDAFESWLETLPAVEKVHSIGDVLKRVNLALVGEEVLPESSEAVAQAYLLIEDEPKLQYLVRDEGSTGRLSARVSMAHAKELVAYVPEIERRIETDFPTAELRLEPTGLVKLMSEMEAYIVSSQVSSFSSAFLLVALVMFAVLRSFKLGVMAMVPNLVPVIMGFGLMGLLGIALDPGTAMVASISMGLVVDDTIHVMSRVRMECAKGLELSEAFARVVPEVGRAVVSTTVILGAGFGVLTFGSFRPNVFLGGITAVIVVFAVFADLFLLPALFAVTGPRRER